MYELEIYEEGHFIPVASGSDLEVLIINHRITIDKEMCRIIKILTAFNFPKGDKRK